MSSVNETAESKTLKDQTQDDKALESLGIVVGEIAHDFNNILSLISGYVEMALSEIPEGERARSDLEHVLAATDRATELVARIRTFSSNTRLKQQAISIDKPVADALTYLQTRMPASVTLTSKIEGSKGRTVLGNNAEIYNVINNLCRNSIQAMPATGGEISVSVDYVRCDTNYSMKYPGLSERDYVKITVKDDGEGMSIDTVEKMYLPFYTTSEESESSKKLAGLGLTTVHNIVTNQGGMIYVDSELGEGTTFELFLPLVRTEVQEDIKTSGDTDSGTGSKHILLIDDEASIIGMATQILEKHGYSVTSFMDGQEALSHFKNQPYQFDLIITDLIMPTYSGSELASAITEVNPNVPIILSTGFSDKISKSACASWGVDKVINKPFTISELLTAIEHLS
ncbi:MAG: response regulator [Gammaproteobacteria bacterium]